jgi:hypothetical protein
MAIPQNNEISLRFFKVKKNTTYYFYTVQTPLTLRLRPEDGPVQGPKHVVFSLNKRLLQILQLCFDLPYFLPHLRLFNYFFLPLFFHFLFLLPLSLLIFLLSSSSVFFSSFDHIDVIHLVFLLYT